MNLINKKIDYQLFDGCACFYRSCVQPEFRLRKHVKYHLQNSLSFYFGSRVVFYRRGGLSDFLWWEAVGESVEIN